MNNWLLNFGGLPGPLFEFLNRGLDCRLQSIADK